MIVSTISRSDRSLLYALSCLVCNFTCILYLCGCKKVQSIDIQLGLCRKCFRFALPAIAYAKKCSYLCSAKMKGFDYIGN